MCPLLTTKATTAQQQQQQQRRQLLLLLPLSWAELRHPYPYVKPQRTRTALDRPLPHLLYSSTSAPLPALLCLCPLPCPASFAVSPLLLPLLDSFVLVHFYWISFCCCCDLSRILSNLLFLSPSPSPFLILSPCVFYGYLTYFLSLRFFVLISICLSPCAAAVAVSVCGFDSFSHFIYFHFHFPLPPPCNTRSRFRPQFQVNLWFSSML